ncbi:hypothetical protein ACIQYW_18510 [Rhodococcus erythropolis]|uniref:hypothetical protein n=1 Tax=Rhodococcus baikonurensis TaxID=172041 RepID=UPI003392AEF5
MPPTHPSQADVAAAYRTLIAHETEPKEQDFYRDRLQRLEQATEPECEFDCRIRVPAAGVGVYCPQCSAKCADTDLTTQLAKAIRAAWVDRLDWDELAQGALEFLTSTGRLLAADGLVLAGAEKAALKRLLAAQTGIVSRDVYEAIECLRALFPATEPAEDAPCAICNVNETNHAGVSYYHPFTTELGPFDDEGNDHPDPAEPAEPLRFSVLEGLCGYCLMGRVFCDAIGGCVESRAAKARRAEPAAEETKAVASDWCILCRRSGHNHTAHKPQAPSPVVPAPTETGPWPSLKDIPAEVSEVRDVGKNLWRRKGGNWEWKTADGRWFEVFNPRAADDLAPFVAAEEG